MKLSSLSAQRYMRLGVAVRTGNPGTRMKKGQKFKRILGYMTLCLRKHFFKTEQNLLGLNNISSCPEIYGD